MRIRAGVERKADRRSTHGRDAGIGPMAWHDFLAIFALSLAASLHCAQMCGPIILSFSCATSAGGPGPVSSAFLYNCGRILTYTALGALAGAVGGAMTTLGQLAGI